MHREPQEHGAALASLKDPCHLFSSHLPRCHPALCELASYPEFVLDTAVSSRRLVLNH
jgi:hypothetical protein